MFLSDQVQVKQLFEGNLNIQIGFCTFSFPYNLRKNTFYHYFILNFIAFIHGVQLHAGRESVSNLLLPLFAVSHKQTGNVKTPDFQYFTTFS